MWYWIADRNDAQMEAAARLYGERLTTASAPPKDAEAVFLAREGIAREAAPGLCIAVNRSETVEEAGWTYAVREPFDREQLVRLVKGLCGRPAAAHPYRMTEACLDALALPKHLLGYRYIAACVSELRTSERPMQLSVLHDLYPSVAAQYGTTPLMVKRAIRHAIDSAWKRGSPIVQRSYFGYASSDKRGVPTNTEFIFALYERLRLLDA